MKTSSARPCVEEVRIPCPGVVLDGDLVVPDDACGLVLFAHGSGSSRHSPRNRWVAEQMHGRQLATLLFDLLTPAEAEAEAQSGALRFDIPFLTERLITASRWVASHPAAGRLGIGYFGASTGAAAAMAAAAEMPETMAVVSRGGRTDLAGEALSRVMAPTLMIVGSRDHPLVEWNRQSMLQMNCEKRLVLVEGATHLFSEPGALERVAELAGDWFANHFNPNHVQT